MGGDALRVERVEELYGEEIVVMHVPMLSTGTPVLVHEVR